MWTMNTLNSVSTRLKIQIRRHTVNCSGLDPPQPLHSSGNFSIKFTRIWMQILAVFLALASKEWASHSMVSKNYMGWGRCSSGAKPASWWSRSHMILMKCRSNSWISYGVFITVQDPVSSRVDQWENLQFMSLFCSAEASVCVLHRIYKDNFCDTISIRLKFLYNTDIFKLN